MLLTDSLLFVCHLCAAQQNQDCIDFLQNISVGKDNHPENHINLDQGILCEYTLQYIKYILILAGSFCFTSCKQLGVAGSFSDCLASL